MSVDIANFFFLRKLSAIEGLAVAATSYLGYDLLSKLFLRLSTALVSSHRVLAFKRQWNT